MPLRPPHNWQDVATESVLKYETRLHFAQQQSADVECSTLRSLRMIRICLRFLSICGQRRSEQKIHLPSIGRHGPRSDGHLTALTLFQCVAD